VAAFTAARSAWTLRRPIFPERSRANAAIGTSKRGSLCGANRVRSRREDAAPPTSTERKTPGTRPTSGSCTRSSSVGTSESCVTWYLRSARESAGNRASSDPPGSLRSRSAHLSKVLWQPPREQFLFSAPIEPSSAVSQLHVQLSVPVPAPPVVEGVLVQEVALVEEEDRVKVFFGEVVDALADGVEDGGGAGAGRQAEATQSWR
jgi:hypothetical protein